MVNISKIRAVFQQQIKPELGNIKKEEKYLKVITQLAENSFANLGKGIREAELTDDARPATHILNKLANKDFVEITFPVGDGILITDPVNNRRALFNKQQFIQDYYNNFRNHLSRDSTVKNIVMSILNTTNNSEFEVWLASLEHQRDFNDYNMVVFGLLEKGIKTQGYGPLSWRKMAKYYNISCKTKKLMED